MKFNNIINSIIKRFKNFYNYEIKKFFYMHHFTRKKLNFEWEKTNDLRIKVINNILKKTKEKRYLEIGCDLNQVFDKIQAEKKFGVDPVRGGNIRATSDKFFENNSEIFDVIFIDGLHEYDQIKKDIDNSLKFLDQEGFIVIHDLLPRNWLEEHVPRLSSTWCGDIWKISFDLLKTENIKFELLLIDFGLGIIKKENKIVKLYNSNLKGKNFEYLVENYQKLPLLNKNELVKYLD